MSKKKLKKRICELEKQLSQNKLVLIDKDDPNIKFTIEVKDGALITSKITNQETVTTLNTITNP